jgi:hypothetical protein
VLAPDEPGAAAEHRQVDQPDRRTILDRHLTAAARAPRPRFAGLDVDAQRLAGDVDHGEHVHVGESDQQLADARALELHRGSTELDDLKVGTWKSSPWSVASRTLARSSGSVSMCFARRPGTQHPFTPSSVRWIGPDS